MIDILRMIRIIDMLIVATIGYIVHINIAVMVKIFRL